MKATTISLLTATFLLAYGCGGEQPKSTTSAASDTASTTTVAAAAAAPAEDPAELAEHGKELFGQNCATCHGASGKGDGPGAAALNPKPRNFTDTAYMEKLKDTDIRNTIKYGGSIKGMPQMPSNPQYDEKQLSQLVAYVRTFSQKKS